MPGGAMTGITDQLINFASHPADSAARDMMRLSLFDWAACGIAGAYDPEFTGFRTATIGQGGAAEASVLGGGAVPAANAALINGTLSHALDFDDTHFAHIGHPSVAVVPAALALAEQQNLDFETFLEAALIGVEASIHVGLWLGRDHYEVGFHQTATAGAFGATLAAARLLRLSPDQIRHALGLCASLASGVKAQFGTGGKPLNAGLAARSGVEAGLWAQSGVTAAADGLAGPLGFGTTHHGAGDTTSLATLGQSPWQILSISHKFHACCHGLHAMLEALYSINIVPQRIEKMKIKTHPRWMSVCNKPDPETGLAAKFSYRHTAAMAVLGKSTAQREMFSDTLANDPELRAMRQKVSVEADAQLSEMQAEVAITLNTGETFHAAHDLAAPITLELRAEKLRVKAAGLLGETRAYPLWQCVQDGDLAGFTAALRGSERG
ncbi:MmgE/PrpD family protein [uncultured Roseobacter sp.]|uniref:MmgE/PrpD family protein n=1 Tax=uncultured Roseobacter sp. TaxID=114847 RepID=UPI00260A9BFC|nr:MmgE/PrpD family protein [uncultured Roseobacter sp.]